MSNKLKLNKTNQTIKLNNKLYIPFNIHTLQHIKKYNKINNKYIFKFNSLIYICSTQLNNYKTILNLLNSSKLNKYSLN
jgi:hypothetical protein